MKQLTTIAIAATARESLVFFVSLAFAKGNINVITQLTRDLTDIYALFLGRCTPSGVVHIYQSNPSRLCYNIVIYIIKAKSCLCGLSVRPSLPYSYLATYRLRTCSKCKPRLLASTSLFQKVSNCCGLLSTCFECQGVDDSCRISPTFLQNRIMYTTFLVLSGECLMCCVGYASGSQFRGYNFDSRGSQFFL